jgi:hypothetical protein
MHRRPAIDRVAGAGGFALPTDAIVELHQHLVLELDDDVEMFCIMCDPRCVQGARSWGDRARAAVTTSVVCR